jgi:hypothetical protein
MIISIKSDYKETLMATARRHMIYVQASNPMLPPSLPSTCTLGLINRPIFVPCKMADWTRTLRNRVSSKTGAVEATSNYSWGKGGGEHQNSGKQHPCMLRRRVTGVRMRTHCDGEINAVVKA